LIALAATIAVFLIAVALQPSELQVERTATMVSAAGDGLRSGQRLS
jgi:hypothetical protein